MTSSRKPRPIREEFETLYKAGFRQGDRVRKITHTPLQSAKWGVELTFTHPCEASQRCCASCRVRKLLLQADLFGEHCAQWVIWCLRMTPKHGFYLRICSTNDSLPHPTFREVCQLGLQMRRRGVSDVTKGRQTARSEKRAKTTCNR